MAKAIQTVVVLSGGLDSVTMAHLLADQGGAIRLFYADYGKPVSVRELAVAKHNATVLGSPLEIMDFTGFFRLQLGYVPFLRLYEDEGDIEWPGSKPSVTQPSQTNDIKGREDDIHVSGYHSLLSVSTYFAQLVGAPSISLGITKEQIDHNPLITDAVAAWEKLIQSMNPAAGTFNVAMPLAAMTKADIVSLGAKLNIPLELTWSCYHGKEAHCGECNNCLHRRAAFRSAGVPDKTTYLK
jgi:7-cyano-7-deazaguanine synthase